MEFNNKWVLWCHVNKNDWTLKSYAEKYTIQNIEEFWALFNNLDKLNLGSNYYFLMREGITPIWEDPQNKTGGSWSFKISPTKVCDLFTDLAVYTCGETLLKKEMSCNGISICCKKKDNYVVKIWNNDNKDVSTMNINIDILKKWGTDIIYSANLCEN